mmetsp:Transcript_25115/g.58322  ORF Transcript_25115/g.58322 Transcript_25115/m.58322 type:complete len:143 (+) Transcript_25115:407-835(+)
MLMPPLSLGGASAAEVPHTAWALTEELTVAVAVVEQQEVHQQLAGQVETEASPVGAAVAAATAAEAEVAAGAAAAAAAARPAVAAAGATVSAVVAEPCLGTVLAAAADVMEDMAVEARNKNAGHAKPGLQINLMTVLPEVKG